MKTRRILALVSVFGTLLSMTGILSVAKAAAPFSYGAGKPQTYIVLYKSNAVSSNAAEVIAEAGGTLVYRYDKIGVAIARSDNEFFDSNLMLDGSVEGVAATTQFATKLDVAFEVVDAAELAQNANAGSWPDGDPLSYLQWDMVQIHVPEAHQINTGSRSIVVGDIDTGLDYLHPDLAANVDFANSVSCLDGVPNQDPAAWMDENGHGTHTAGTIAAAKNGIGIVGVAPTVKIAGIRAGNADGYFFPEAVICSFMWAGDNRLDVTNNSYYVDPWLFNCRNDADQRAIWKAEQRAIRYAMSQGVVVVASQGNENNDLSKQNYDTSSPSYPPGNAEEREVTNACAVIPVEIPGVIGVTADGAFMQKAFYSSYGVGVAQVTAPGGDPYFQNPGDGSLGYVWSTYYRSTPVPAHTYAGAAGTSMASPHAAGVAALILSQFGKMPQGAVQSFLTRTADALSCPPNPFDPGGASIWSANCEGGEGYNGFYGHGQVNADSAVNAVTFRPIK